MITTRRACRARFLSFTIAALAVASYDKTSFGCDPGTDRTVFGTAYQRALEANMPDPEFFLVDWKKVFETVAKRLIEKETIEREEYETIIVAQGIPLKKKEEGKPAT